MMLVFRVQSSMRRAKSLRKNRHPCQIGAAPAHDRQPRKIVGLFHTSINGASTIIAISDEVLSLSRAMQENLAKLLIFQLSGYFFKTSYAKNPIDPYTAHPFKPST
jgi:hypothetical protein